jgi:ribosome biogenesis protein ERB1
VTRSSTKRVPKRRTPRSVDKSEEREAVSSRSNISKRGSTKKDTLRDREDHIDSKVIVDNDDEEEQEEETAVNRDLLASLVDEVDEVDEDEDEDGKEDTLEEAYEVNRTREVDLGEEEEAKDGEDWKNDVQLEGEGEEEEEDEEDVIDSDEEFDLDDESSSEDEGPRNTIGNVPLSWYDEYDHIGYDREGKRIVRKNQPQSAIMEALRQSDDPDYLRTVYDAYNDESIRLSTDEIQTAIKVLRGQCVGADADIYYPMISIDSEYFPGIAPEPKRRFVPSKWEHKKVMRIVRAIRKGWIKVDEKPANQDDSHMNYVLWDDEKDDEQDPFRRIQRLPPPKLPLPSHAHSYNPPAEYLYFDDERKKDGMFHFLMSALFSSLSDWFHFIPAISMEHRA